MRGQRPPQRLPHLLLAHHDALAVMALVVVVIACLVALLWIADDAIGDVLIHSSGTV
jgi:hypothetical protein